MARAKKTRRDTVASLESLEERRVMAAVADGGFPDLSEPVFAARSLSVEERVIGETGLAVRSNPGTRTATQTATTLAMIGSTPGGMRGDRTSYNVVLRDGSGMPLAGQVVEFSHSCRYFGTRSLGTVTTDSAGVATLDYRVPSDPAADNVSMTARFAGTAAYRSSVHTVSKVEIGRSVVGVTIDGPNRAVTEGAESVFTIRLSQQASRSVTVRYGTRDLTAVAGSDYTATRGAITFAPGELRRQITVATRSDRSIEPDETFEVAVTGASGAQVGSRATVTTTIRDSPPEGGKGSWTILVYMTGADLNASAKDDINEMETALRTLPAGVRFVVAWDQPAVSEGMAFATGGGKQAPWRTYGRSVLQADSDPLTIASTFDLTAGEQNTGAASTLADFITWGVTKAPADRYVLQMWGHGGGLYGSQFDAESNTDALTIDEMVKALSTTGVPKMDILSYDNCLMGMAEVGMAVAPYVSGVFVASEEYVMDSGQDYTTAYRALASATPAAVTAAAVAQGMVQSYGRQYAGNDLGYDTFSAVSTAGYKRLATALQQFVNVTVAHPTSLAAAIDDARPYLQSFGLDDLLPFWDLGVFMANISSSTIIPQDVRTAAKKVQEAVSAMVISKTDDQRECSGMAVYLPGLETGYRDLASAFCNATGWDRFAAWSSPGLEMLQRQSSSTAPRPSPPKSLLDRQAISADAWAVLGAVFAEQTEGEAAQRRRRLE